MPRLQDQEPVRPATDSRLTALQFDRVGEQVGKLSQLLGVLDEIAVTGAPNLDASAETWSRYIDRIAAILEATQSFASDVEDLTLGFANRLRLDEMRRRELNAGDRHAA